MPMPNSCMMCFAAGPAVLLYPLSGGGFICQSCANTNQLGFCQDCGAMATKQEIASNKGCCAWCYHKRMAATQQIPPRWSGINRAAHTKAYTRTYPGAHIPVWEDERPKISSESAFWKQNLEQKEMPWNFYEALVIAAKALQGESSMLLSASIDKDGWLKLKYTTQTVKMKITEITIEPPEG